MKFDLYKSAVVSKQREKEIAEKDFLEIVNSENVNNLIEQYRAGDANAKKNLPAWTPMGKSRTGFRLLEDIEPTGLVMVDIDHIPDEKMTHVMECFNNITTLVEWEIVLVHITPSGHGLRIIFTLPDDCKTIVEAQDKIVRHLHLDQYGDYDGACKYLTRLSFFPRAKDIRYRSESLFLDHSEQAERLKRYNSTSAQPQKVQQAAAPVAETAAPALASETTEEGVHADFTYGGRLMTDIVKSYVEYKGTPAEGSTHNFYNGLVKNFRHICNNDPEILIDVLPLFGQTRANRLSQCESICRNNDADEIPKRFYYWLKDCGYYVANKNNEEAEEIEAEDPYKDEEDMLKCMPALPPVFREFVNIAPKDFKIPTIFALLPVMGTNATYLQSRYLDGEIHTTTFFTVVSATASSGKSFIRKFLSTVYEKSGPSNLLDNVCRRDVLTSYREQLYALHANAKSANDKGSIPPRVSRRIASPIISQPELLTKMADNRQMHMFIFAPEIDTFNKGARAGGSDKNDLYRTAWDNDPYSQQFKTTTTFKGSVCLYLNVLMTGTPLQCKNYFKDSENGLVSRFSITDLGNQDFAKFPHWKELTKKDLTVIKRFVERCDANTYKTPLDFDLSAIYDYTSEDEYDDNVPWRYEPKGRQTIDMGWFLKDINKWVEKKRIQSLANSDFASDKLRRRAAVKAFRLALLCHACWNNVGKHEREIIKKFALWFAELDLMMSKKFYGEEINKQHVATKVATMPVKKYGSLLESLPVEFDSQNIIASAKQLKILTNPRQIAYCWKKDGLIVKIPGTSRWKKVKVA